MSGERPMLCAMVACARLSEKRRSEHWSLRKSLPDAGEETNDQMVAGFENENNVKEVGIR